MTLLVLSSGLIIYAIPSTCTHTHTHTLYNQARFLVKTKQTYIADTSQALCNIYARTIGIKSEYNQLGASRIKFCSMTWSDSGWWQHVGNLHFKYSNFLQTFNNLSESDCSQSKPDCSCLHQGCLLSGDLCNCLAVKSCHECATTSGVETVAKCENIQYNQLAVSSSVYL